MASPVSTPIMFHVAASDPDTEPTLATCTFIGHDRDQHGCECAHSLRPWHHCPAHHNRARIMQRAGLPTGGPYWARESERS